MTKTEFRIIFLLFLLSGFCALLYQVVWIRLSFASFGIITPVLSVVISVYMFGLSIGSWFGGKWIEKKNNAIYCYAAAEIMVGIGAFTVPVLFKYGERLLLHAGDMGSFTYLILSALMITISILPCCIVMGFTFPFMMAFIEQSAAESKSSFSYLYFANVIGAMLGTVVTAVVLIEMLGFHRTLATAAAINFLIAGTACLLGVIYKKPARIKQSKDISFSRHSALNHLSTQDSALICILLFTTGMISMSMEVIWIRAFTPVLKNLTYSFASLLGVYLLGTWLGSYLYRSHLEKNKTLPAEKIISSLAVVSLLPVLMNDPRLAPGIFSVLVSILPFSAALGYLTPNLIDTYSAGNPSKGGRAYALNILGCIIGPLLSSYLLLPYLGVKKSILLLSLPFLFIILFYRRRNRSISGWDTAMAVVAIFFFFQSTFFYISFEDLFASIPGSETRRDHTGTVVSYGTGLQKKLLVNGIGLTALTPITKSMAHLPLALCSQKPESALVICFGMGTTFRSLLSWDIQTTAVELVPGVKDAFGYYFTDAEKLMENPKAKIVIDDGRRFLCRTKEMYDVITIDPPPPIEAAGSSLLYSEEFYALARQRLKKGGVLQQWFPAGDPAVLHAVTKAITNSFPYVVAYSSIENWGIHFFAAQHPLTDITAQGIYERIPLPAKKDFLEWERQNDLLKILHFIFDKGSILDSIMIDCNSNTITDDKPYNEYFILRKFLYRWR